MIIDCHGHYTTEPKAHLEFRQLQLAALESGGRQPAYPEIGDAEIRISIEENQLRLLRERGADVTIFSPRASGMGHHVRDQAVNVAWSRACNDLIARVTRMFPENFFGVCQLPQAAGAPLSACVEELRRCVLELGFVGCNLNPDPSGGAWTEPPLTDRSWYPLYEAMVELDVPGMIHVSGSCNPCLHTTGAHYISGDVIAFMQLLQGDLFQAFPTLRLILPHGGGAAPYHWGRYRGLAQMLGKPRLGEHLMRNLYFDTCVYHQAGIDLLFEVIGPESILFGSEMLGAVRGVDPETGHPFDDTKRYIDRLVIPDQMKTAVFETNARRAYPRLDAVLTARGR